MTEQPVPGSVAIIGGGIGGFTTAQELRRRGFGGTIAIVDPEGIPYDRPPLSKQYLDGEYDAEKLWFVPASWFEENSVEVVADRADRILVDEGAVLLESGRHLAADVVVLATGGIPRHLPCPGGDSDGLVVLRTKADGDLLRAKMQAGGSLAIIGAGLIGAEVASTAAKMGITTTLIDPVDVPLVPAVGPEIAEALHAMHAKAGIDVVTGMVTRIEPRGAGFHLELDGGLASGGREVDADTVLVAIGIEAEMGLAVSAGLDIDNGVLVDAHQRTTNPKIYAVGDAARMRLADGTLHRRHEHWESAMHEAQTAAASIMGEALPIHSTSWFWSDRHGVHVEGVGSMVAPGRNVVREVDGAPQIVFRVTDDDKVVGAAAIDGGMGVRAARRLIDRGTVVDAAQLADPAVQLKKLAK
ncbi:FAD-dependent oxidoreductase [Mariniluteicoccus endophyticus]